MACPDLAPLARADLVTLSGKVVEISGQYYQCRAKNNALINSVNGVADGG